MAPAAPDRQRHAASDRRLIVLGVGLFVSAALLPLATLNAGDDGLLWSQGAPAELVLAHPCWEPPHLEAEQALHRQDLRTAAPDHFGLTLQ
jgi:hypothetical protein